MERGTGSEIHESVLDLIGETPLVRLSRLDPGARTPIVAKVEYLNPEGIGLADSVLHDERGPIGRALQTLLVRERQPARA